MTVQFGAYGKISGLGDFLRLNLPGDFVRSWDDWLQAGLLAARGSLGEAWDDCYLSAPIWRFSLPGGVLGSHAVSGVLMASVDRVGRQFPLAIAARFPAGNTALRHFAAGALFARIEDIALATLEDGADRDALSEALSALDPAETPTDMPSDTLLEAGRAYAGPLPPEQVLAARALRDRRGEVGIWTAQVGGDHRMLLSDGLPDTRQVAALFDLDAALWRSGPVAQPA